MNARSKAYEPSANSNYEKEMEKSFTVILCNLRALEEIRRIRVLRKSGAMRQTLNTEHSELVCNQLRAESIPEKSSTVNKLTWNRLQKLRPDECV